MQKIPAILLSFLLLCTSPANAAQVSALAGLAPAEQDYYEMVFNYTMDNTKANDKYEWKSYGGNGSISPGESFISKSNSTCRKFTQNYSVQGVDGADQGIACKRGGKDGWCRLKPGNAQTCSLEEPGNAGGVAMGGGINMPGGVNVGGGPDVNMPSLGGGGGVNTNVNMPDVKAPKTPSGKQVAHSVTTGVGQAAGTAAGTAGHWFSELFR